MVPCDWIHTTFEKHIDLLNGFAFKSANYSSEECDIRLLRGDNIKPGSLRWRGVKCWPVNELEKLNKFQLAEHDFVIAMDRTWITSGLKVAEVKQSDLPCLLVQRVSRIRALHTLEQSLLRQYFSSHRFEQYVKSVQTETAVPHISPSQIKEFSFLLPPFPEQRKIASILGTWDKAISTTERLIDNSKQQKKALMQQLLTGKKRLFDDSGKPFEGEWKEVKLSNVANIVMGSSPKSSSYNEISEGLPLIQGNADIKNRKSAPRIYTSEVTKKCGIDDILLSVRAPVGTIAKSIHEACIGRGISAIKAKKENSQSYIYQFLLWFEERWDKYSQGSTFEAVNSNDIKSLHLLIPSFLEQQKIASVLINADKETVLLEQQLADLKQEKKALIQQLLTGKRRVKIDEAEVA